MPRGRGSSRLRIELSARTYEQPMRGSGKNPHRLAGYFNGIEGKSSDGDTADEGQQQGSADRQHQTLYGCPAPARLSYPKSICEDVCHGRSPCLLFECCTIGEGSGQCAHLSNILL